jgi:DeoR/GlpR family transcriptional regulator of sugar metabolism
VLLGGGTTLVELARALPDTLEATLVTSAPDVAVTLLDHPGLEIVQLGGAVNGDSRTVVGPDAYDAVRGLRADLCMLGACSVHSAAGVTVLHRDEAMVQRAMIARAVRTAVLVDASKLGSTGPYVIAPIRAIDVLVTDARAPLRDLAHEGIEVIRA